jgi:serine/threonine protein kinase
MEYAEGGTLRNYLNENFLSLNWEDKYRLALQLSDSIKCLHENGMARKDLDNQYFIDFILQILSCIMS